MKSTIKTNNTEYGFYGTTSINYNEKETLQRWNEAVKTLIELSGKTKEEIRDFLDGRFGRYLADECIDNNVREIILKNYFKWIDKDLHKNNRIINIDKTLFGTQIENAITGSVDVILYTFKKDNRVHKDYAKCINRNEEIYEIGMNYITPIEN